MNPYICITVFFFFFKLYIYIYPSDFSIPPTRYLCKIFIFIFFHILYILFSLTAKKSLIEVNRGYKLCRHGLIKGGGYETYTPTHYCFCQSYSNINLFGLCRWNLTPLLLATTLSVTTYASFIEMTYCVLLQESWQISIAFACIPKMDFLVHFILCARYAFWIWTYLQKSKWFSTIPTDIFRIWYF